MNHLTQAQLFTMSDENVIVGYQEMEEVVKAGRELVNGDQELYVAYYQEIRRRGLRVL